MGSSFRTPFPKSFPSPRWLDFFAVSSPVNYASPWALWSGPSRNLFNSLLFVKPSQRAGNVCKWHTSLKGYGLVTLLEASLWLPRTWGIAHWWLQGGRPPRSAIKIISRLLVDPAWASLTASLSTSCPWFPCSAPLVHREVSLLRRDGTAAIRPSGGRGRVCIEVRHASIVWLRVVHAARARDARRGSCRFPGPHLAGWNFFGVIPIADQFPCSAVFSSTYWLRINTALRDCEDDVPDRL